MSAVKACEIYGVELGGNDVTTKISWKRVAVLAQGRQLGAPLRDLLLFVRFYHECVVRITQRPLFRLASMKSSRSPSSTACVFPVSTPVRRSLMRD